MEGKFDWKKAAITSIVIILMCVVAWRNGYNQGQFQLCQNLGGEPSTMDTGEEDYKLCLFNQGLVEENQLNLYKNKEYNESIGEFVG